MDLFRCDNYKTYFHEMIKEMGAAGRGEFRRMAEVLGVHPTMISQVLSGPKDFTSEQVVLLAKHYRLSKVDTQYLILLVEIERAGSVELRRQFVDMKDDLKKRSRALDKRLGLVEELSDLQKATYFSSWIYAAIHNLTGLERKVTIDFICKRLKISMERAREVLDFLIEAGIVSEQGGAFKAGQTMVHIMGTPHVAKCHTNWRIRAIEKLEELSADDTMYSVSVSLSREDFKRLREEMSEFKLKFLKTVHASPAEDIAQFNMDFFWI